MLRTTEYRSETRVKKYTLLRSERKILLETCGWSNQASLGWKIGKELSLNMRVRKQFEDLEIRDVIILTRQIMCV
jgi:hypothetical protein